MPIERLDTLGCDPRDCAHRLAMPARSMIPLPLVAAAIIASFSSPSHAAEAGPADDIIADSTIETEVSIKSAHGKVSARFESAYMETARLPQLPLYFGGHAPADPVRRVLRSIEVSRVDGSIIKLPVASLRDLLQAGITDHGVVFRTWNGGHEFEIHFSGGDGEKAYSVRFQLEQKKVPTLTRTVTRLNFGEWQSQWEWRDNAWVETITLVKQ